MYDEIVIPELPWKRVELTKDQEKAWTETKAAFIVTCPAFAHIFYTLMNPGKSDHIAYFTTDTPTAAVNGVAVFVNPEFFFKLPMKKRMFVIAHEILHCVFDHIGQGWRYYKLGKIALPSGKSVEYNPTIANCAQDYVINDILVESKVGECDKGWLHDKAIGTHEDTWPAVYEKLLKKGKGKGGSRPGARIDVHMAPSKGIPEEGQPGQEKKVEPRNEAEWRTTVAAAIAAGSAQGSMPATLQRALETLLEPKVSWGEYIQGWLARKLGSASSDWRRCDRRMVVRDLVGLAKDRIYAPARRGNGTDTVVVAVDTSGSISDTEIKEFFAEIGGVLTDVRPERIVLVWIDAAVQRVDEIEDAEDLDTIRRLGGKGGGGTDFRPLFKHIDKNGIVPDAVLYLTDGQGTFPAEKPAYPVLWGSILEPPKSYPFGEVIMIPRRQ